MKIVDIIPAQPADFEQLLFIWEDSVRATHDFLVEDDIQAIKPFVVDAFQHGTLIYVARHHSNRLVGFLGIAERKIEMLFIDPVWRGQGVGRHLLKYAIEKLNATELDVNEQNEQAIGFYERLGFKTYGRSPVDGLGKPFPLLHMRLTLL